MTEEEEEAEARMLAALSKAVEREIDEGNANELMAPSPTPDPSPTPSPSPSTSPSTSTSPNTSDAFAPPENSAAVAALDIDHGAVARSTAPRAAERISVARRVEVVAAPHTSSGGAGRVVIVLLLLAVIGAAGFAGYRYATLGYVLSPPAAASPVAVVLAIAPESAVVRIDGEPVDGKVALPPGRHELIASAPARLTARHAFEVGDEPGRVALRLPSGLVPLVSQGTVPFTFTPQAASTDVATLPAVDDILAKLMLVHDCVSRIAVPVSRARAAYVAALKQKGNDRETPTIPGSEVEQCRSLIERAVAAVPPIEQLDTALLAYGRGLAALESQARAMATYYKDGKHRSDGGAFARKNEKPLAAAFQAADTSGLALEALAVAIAEAWQLRELEVLERLEGDTPHILARRAAIAAHRLALAALTGDDRRRAESRARLDEASAAARAAAAALGKSGDALLAALALAPQPDASRADWLAWQASIVDTFNRIEIRSAASSPAARPPRPDGR